MKTNALRDQTQHLLIKLAPTHRTPGFRTDDVIAAHNAIVNRKGTVWLGKAGRPLGPSCVQLFNTSIEQNKPSQLILARRLGNMYEYFGARIHAVHVDIFRPPIEYVPEYYRDIIKGIETWIEIGSLSKMQQRHLDKLVVTSSQRSLIEVVSKSQASTMIVCEKP